MSAQALWCGAGRRSLCSSQCLLSRCARAYYSQSALSSVVGLTRGFDVSAPPGKGTRTATRSDSGHAVADTKNPLDPTRLDRYLASTRAADFEPTLEDVERCKPESFSRLDLPRYAIEYTNLLETLCRSFSKDQLRRFTELYKLDPIWTRSSRRKTEYAESIIEKAWGWPSLKEIERKQQDVTEMLAKSFTVTPSQLFLIMGKDGADLLQLSMQYNVHISLTPSPLALRVEGLRGSLKGLSEHISTLKKGIIDEVFELPSRRPVRPDLLQRISRLSGAYVENHGNRGKVRICAKNLDDITNAKRLVLRASLEVGTQAHTFCYDPPRKMRDSPIETPGQQRHAIYPFAVPYSFPWTMHSGGVFRLRRVADWLGVDSCENMGSIGGLTDNLHRLLHLNKRGGEFSRLVCSTAPENASYGRKTITAVLGHVLISSSDSSQRDPIFSPLRGTSSLSDILEWIETSRAPLSFVPSVHSVMTEATVIKQRVLRRLVYKTLPQIIDQVSELPPHVLKFEMELSCPPPTSTEAVQCPESAPKFKDMLSSDELNSNTDSLSSHPSASHSGSLSEGLNNRWAPSCQAGSEVYVNLMLPDRPMDVQLCIFDWDDVTLSQQPQMLQEYAETFRNFLANKTRLPQPDPPSAFDYEGRTYYLYNNFDLKQSNNPSLFSARPTDCYVDELVGISSENITDLQSNQKMELCQVKIDGLAIGPSWKRFLGTCDQLSVVSFGAQHKRDKPQMT